MTLEQVHVRECFLAHWTCVWLFSGVLLPMDITLLLSNEAEIAARIVAFMWFEFSMAVKMTRELRFCVEDTAIAAQPLTWVVGSTASEVIGLDMLMQALRVCEDVTTGESCGCVNDPIASIGAV